MRVTVNEVSSHLCKIFTLIIVKPYLYNDYSQTNGGVTILGFADNFFQRIMRFKQFFSLHFVMKTIFMTILKKRYRLFYGSYLK